MSREGDSRKSVAWKVWPGTGSAAPVAMTSGAAGDHRAGASLATDPCVADDTARVGPGEVFVRLRWLRRRDDDPTTARISVTRVSISRHHQSGCAARIAACAAAARSPALSNKREARRARARHARQRRRVGRVQRSPGRRRSPGESRAPALPDRCGPPARISRIALSHRAAIDAVPRREHRRGRDRDARIDQQDRQPARSPAAGRRSLAPAAARYARACRAGRRGTSEPSCGAISSQILDRHAVAAAPARATSPPHRPTRRRSPTRPASVCRA